MRILERTLLLLIAMIAPPTCFGARVVLITAASEEARPILSIATEFYGVDLMVMRASATANWTILRDDSTAGVVIAAGALPEFVKDRGFQYLSRPGQTDIPLLISDISSQTSIVTLTKLVSLTPPKCRQAAPEVRLGSYIVGHVAPVTRELSGQELPEASSPVCTFISQSASIAKPLLSLRAGASTEPFFALMESGRTQIFLLSALASHSSTERNEHPSLVQQFAGDAPIMMFIRYAAGARGWHAPGHYANFTIDDAWLKEPYGGLDYLALLEEMQKHNFHTTIAFIPWNYDRSEPSVVRIFLGSPERYSIVVHGNNHTHREFGDEKTSPLTGQINNLRQSLARMEEFQHITGIPFDRVMIFPYEALPPRQTLDVMQKMGFLAVANADIVPLGLSSPVDPLFRLRGVSSELSAFPLIPRYPAEVGISDARIAVDAFLEHPLLYYGHQDFFAGGIGAFDSIADRVNRTQPDVRWTNLGEIVKHLYLIKERADGNWDVLAHSNDILLENTDDRKRVFFIQRRLGSASRINEVALNGQATTYDVSNDILKFAVSLNPNQTANAVITYQDDIPYGPVAIAHQDLAVTLMRRLSDFRDITMSRFRLGRTITALYYNGKLGDLEPQVELLWPEILIVLACFALGIYLIQKKRRSVKPRAASWPQN